MFSGFSAKKDFGSQQSEFLQHLSSGFGQSFGFLQSVQAIGAVDENVDKLIAFLNRKIEFIDSIPDANQTAKPTNDLNKMKLFISLGAVNIESNTDTDRRDHLKLNKLNTAKFTKLPILQGMKQYFQEYSTKLNLLKEMSLDDYKIPENTGYQLELKNKLKVFINKTKYFIFDIYLNHYVQYIYLLFAINIYKTTESYFVLNAEQQKQLNLVDKTNKLLTSSNQMQANDAQNFSKIKDAMTNLIEKTADISKHNKPTQDEINTLKSLDEKQVGGMIKTVADDIVEKIMEKHNHFYEVYKETRNTMPDYFMKINELIMTKITYLQELNNSIMTLEPKHYDILTKTNDELSKLFSIPELQKNYKIEDNPIVKQNMDKTLTNMSKNIETSIETSKQYAKTLQQETSDMIRSMTPPVVTPTSSTPTSSTPTSSTPTSFVSAPSMVTQGGFVRSSTLFPKNNYKKKKSGPSFK